MFYREYGKRALDVCISMALVIIFFWLFIAVALFIRAVSGSPVFYTQVRTTINGSPFSIFKFRTMDVAQEDETVIWGNAASKKIFWGGRWLRTLCLDEIPQLFNVLGGSMSLVGPRPERDIFVQEFCETLPRYKERMLAKGGVTGLAQVFGFRGDTSLARRLELDLIYIRNLSLALDLKILVVTFLPSKALKFWLFKQYLGDFEL